jgi:hypothetical protein
MGSHKTEEFFFCKYWPNDDLLRPKQVANKRNNKIKRPLCQTEYIFNVILILYFKQNGMSCTSITRDEDDIVYMFSLTRLKNDMSI